MIDCAIRASLQAGAQIREIYRLSDFSIQYKTDSTPVTVADRQADRIVTEILGETKLPVLSEEGKDIPYNVRRNWCEYWLVDPLDGTKEFIKRNDEFTVNIALLRNNIPGLGVIYAPVTGELYVGDRQQGAWKLLAPRADVTFYELKKSAQKLPLITNPEGYVVVVSRSHTNEQTLQYIQEKKIAYPELTVISKGSSLKICMIAEGTARVYPKFGKTMEWDSAAGHAILAAVGKRIVLHDLKTELIYNKEDLTNPDFIAL